MSSGFVHFSRSQFPPKFAVGIFSEHKLLFRQLLLDPKASTKEISIFQNPFKCTIEELSLNL